MDSSNGKSGISANRKSHSASMLAARSRRKPTIGRWTAILVLTPGASGKLSATASLDGPCARRAWAPAGRDEGTASRREQRNSAKQGDY
jgi:hypothetical protein